MQLLTTPAIWCFLGFMTQRNKIPQTLQAMPTGLPEPLRAALAQALVLVLVLITVQPGAGFGYV